MTSAGKILIMPKGNYDSATSYEMLDLVLHNGTSWLAKKSCTGIEPTTANSEYWHCMFDADAFAASLESKMRTVAAEVCRIYL